MLTKFKIGDIVKWVDIESDLPPFTFGTKAEVVELSRDGEMLTVKMLSTGEWVGGVSMYHVELCLE